MIGYHCILNITRNASCPTDGQCLALFFVLDVALVVDANTHRISIPWFNGKKVVHENVQTRTFITEYRH